ncbi:uncharacterized protein LOC115937728 [Leptonychotes weddellii]|uniref:Uncharacterized protein LOC115937728 n=1 Tax=Leptonychotes weddellii TaxID=9713 RepID=A0A7F8Q4T8_LEPWE|nr:uncharacterized protein LOC115937728 [Leptonychotes weddellii]
MLVYTPHPLPSLCSLCLSSSSTPVPFISSFFSLYLVLTPTPCSSGCSQGAHLFLLLSASRSLLSSLSSVSVPHTDSGSMGSPISPRPPSIHTLTRLFLYLLFIDFFALLSPFVFSPTRLHPRGPSRHSDSTPPHALASPLSWTVPPPSHFPSPFLCLFSSLSVALTLSCPSVSSSHICASPRGLHPCEARAPCCLLERGGPSGTHGPGRASPRAGDTRLLPPKKRPRDLCFTRHAPPVTSCQLRGPSAHRSLQLLAHRDGATARDLERRHLSGGGKPSLPSSLVLALSFLRSPSSPGSFPTPLAPHHLCLPGCRAVLSLGGGRALRRERRLRSGV